LDEYREAIADEVPVIVLEDFLKWTDERLNEKIKGNRYG